MIAGNIQNQPFYKKYVDKSFSCPGSDFLHHNSFYCGNYPELNTADLELIKSCYTRSINNYIVPDYDIPAPYV